jgi:hypothetical protein
LESRRAKLESSPPTLSPADVTPADDPYLLPPDEVTIEVAVDGASDLYVLRDGLIWDHLEGHKPGLPSRPGRYVLVDGKPWYPHWQVNAASTDAEQSDAYLLKLGAPVWDVAVLSVSDPDGEPNPGRGSVNHEYDEGRLKLSFKDPADGAGLYRVRLRRPRPGG